MFSERFKTYRRQRGISQKELAATIGTTQQTIAKWEGARSSPSPAMLAKIAVALKVSLDELVLEDEQRAEVRGAAEASSMVTDASPVGLVRDASLAGHSYYVAQDNSMYPAICEGDEILIRHQVIVAEDDVALISLDDKPPVLRRIHIQEGGYLLQPLNSSFSAQYITRASLHRIKIWGKAVELRRTW